MPITNDVWDRPAKMPVSPCNNNCVVSSLTGYCEGCFRLLKEIIDWEKASNYEKENILENCEKRKKSEI